MTLGGSSPKCEIGDDRPSGTDSGVTTSCDVKSAAYDLCENSPSGLVAGCTADVPSCELSCPSVDTSEVTDGLNVGEVDVDNPVPTFSVASAAGVVTGEAGDTTEAVWRGSRSAGRASAPPVGPFSLRSNAVVGLSHTAPEPRFGDGRLKVIMCSSSSSEAQLCADWPVGLWAGVASGDEVAPTVEIPFARSAAESSVGMSLDP